VCTHHPSPATHFIRGGTVAPRPMTKALLWFPERVQRL
jgi:hypothetical protein